MSYLCKKCGRKLGVGCPCVLGSVPGVGYSGVGLKSIGSRCLPMHDSFQICVREKRPVGGL